MSFFGPRALAATRLATTAGPCIMGPVDRKRPLRLAGTVGCGKVSRATQIRVEIGRERLVAFPLL